MKLFYLLILISYQLFACPYERGGFTQGYMDDLWIGENDQFHRFMKDKSDQIDENKFNEITDKITEFYRPVIEKLGGKLVVRKNWEDGTVNAFADREEGGVWSVNMFGGLARHKEITPDGYAMVVCHEIGHHIGGYPRYVKRWQWASSEGQSDYFASSKCLRAVYGEDIDFFVELKNVHSTIEDRCFYSFPFSHKKYRNCVRTALAGQSVANLFANSRRIPKPKVDTPDLKIVKKHFAAHPQPQCRLDTYFQGALCNKKIKLLYGTDDYTEGFCTRIEGYKKSTRSRCWFSPEQAELEAFSF